MADPFLHLWSLSVEEHFYLVAAVLTVVVTLGMSWFFNRTRAGLTLTAVAEEPTTAISLGISVKRAVTLAWMMGSVIATAGAIVLLTGRSITKSCRR